MRNYKIGFKILMVIVLSCLFVFLIDTDREKFQLTQPAGDTAKAEEVLILIEELVLAGITPANETGYREVIEQLKLLETADPSNYITYDLYCRIWESFFVEEGKKKNNGWKEVFDNISYKNKYKEEFSVLREDWYQSYDTVLEYYDLQEEIRVKKIEILCGSEQLTDKTALEEKELLDASGKKYTYLSGGFSGLSYTVVSAYVREDRLLTCKEMLPDDFCLGNIWLMEANAEGGRFFYKDYELNAVWNELPDAPELYREQIADLTFSKGGINNVNIKEERVSGKIVRCSSEEVEIEGHGTYKFKEDCRGYRLYENLREAGWEELSVGYDFADFIIEDEQICGFLLLRKEAMESIRVLIKSQGYSSQYHEQIEVCSREDMILTFGSYENRREERVPAGQIITLTADSPYLKGERVELTPVSHSGRLEVLSLERSQGNPSYRGSLEVAVSEKNGLILINEVLLEEYLYSVVPSEMPASYPMEALKAQAICARTYAYKYLQSPGLGGFGAHVDDSTGYQVYNNIAENVNSTKAVKETSGEILVYEGEPVSTYYYSTSCGYGSDERVWSKEEEKELTYLQPVHLAAPVGEGEVNAYTPEELSSEAHFREYILGTDAVAFEKEEPWYRWKCRVEEIDTELLYQRLAGRYGAAPDKVLTYTGETNIKKLMVQKQESEEAGKTLAETAKEDGFFEQKEPEEFQRIYGMICTERLPGGVMNELLIVTDQGTYKVVSEYNIRYILNQNCLINRQDGSVYEGSSLLPSGYFVLDEIRKEDVVTGYEITGGGYGHGAGLSQNGAKAMAETGYKAGEILSSFYRECPIEKKY